MTFDRNSQQKLHSSKVLADLLVITLLSVIAWVVAQEVDLHERLHQLYSYYSIRGLYEFMVLVPVLITGFAIFSLRRWRELVIEVDQRVTAENRLREADHWFRTMVENIHLLALQLDVQGNIVFCNDYLLDLTGWRREEFIGRNWFDTFVPQDQPHLRQTFQEQIAQGRIPSHYESAVLKQNGERLLVCWDTAMLRDTDGRVIGTMSIGLDITAQRNFESLLYGYQYQLQKLASELCFAEERERRRIAMELHDQVGQNLAFTKIKLRELSRDFSGESASPALQAIDELLSQSIEEVRSLTLDLSPPVLYELGIEAALKSLGERFQKEHGLRVHFSDDGQAKPLSDEVRVMLFHVAREALVNVVKHAEATAVHISMSRDAGLIRLQVADDGKGFDVSATEDPRQRSGFGLFSMRERVQYLGGGIIVESSPGAGTRITVKSPCRGAQTEGETP